MKDKIKNYFEWIANLGVVPLFLFVAFLFAPLFFFLFFLIVSVTLVLDAMINSYAYFKSYLKERYYLSKILHPVKVNLKKIVISQFFILNLHATSNHNENLFIAKGEQASISTEKMTHFSIGNKEVISVKNLQLKEQLLIKGKSIGFTDLIIWQNKKKIQYQIYVLSKKQQMENAQIAELFKNTSISAMVKGGYLFLNGEVNERLEYDLLKKIELQNQKVMMNLKLNHQLKKSILTEIYQLFYENEYKDFECYINSSLYLNCILRGQIISESILKALNEKYFIKISHQLGKLGNENFNISFKIIQVENTSGKEINIGLDKFYTSIAELFELGLKSLIHKNDLSLRQHNLNFSTLAEPQMQIRINQSGELQVGAEIPYLEPNRENANAITQSWKFAGLKISHQIKIEDNKLVFDYQTEFTHPDEGSISGTKERSSIIVGADQYFKLFSIKYKTWGKSINTVPGFSEIPILGKLFGSNNHIENYKQIEGYVKIELMEK